jgi:hypothetical protein
MEYSLRSALPRAKTGPSLTLASSEALFDRTRLHLPCYSLPLGSAVLSLSYPSPTVIYKQAHAMEFGGAWRHSGEALRRFDLQFCPDCQRLDPRPRLNKECRL